MRVETVLLDAGNTVLEIDYAFVAEAIVAAGGATDADDVRRAERHARVALDPLLHDRSTEGRDVKRRYFELTFAGLAGAPPADPAAVVAAIDALENLWRVPAPDAAATIDALRARGLRVGVVSNSDGTVERVLERVGLRDRLDVVIDSAVVGVEKPNPEIFHHALRALGAAAATAIYVGDLPAVDVTGAHAAGLVPVLMDPLGLWPTAVDAVRIARLADLPELIRRGKKNSSS